MTSPEQTPPPERPWPPLPTEIKNDPEATKARATAIANAMVESAKSERGGGAARAKAYDDLNQKLIDTLVTIATGGIDRARAGAQFVQTAATAIAGLYTGVLGVLFVADQAAPSRAFIPMLFLGLSVALATFYLAFVVPGAGIDRPKFMKVPDEDIWVRLNYVSHWVRRIVFPRASALRAAVLSLFLGLLFLPVGIAHLPSDLRLPWEPAQPATPVAAAPVEWPGPTILPDPSLSAILYTAQLEEFRKNLSSPSGSGQTDASNRDNFAAWLIAAGGMIVVLLIWWNPFGWWVPRDRNAPQVSGPDALER